MQSTVPVSAAGRPGLLGSAPTRLPNPYRSRLQRAGRGEAEPREGVLRDAGLLETVRRRTRVLRVRRIAVALRTLREAVGSARLVRCSIGRDTLYAEVRMPDGRVRAWGLSADGVWTAGTIRPPAAETVAVLDEWCARELCAAVRLLESEGCADAVVDIECAAGVPRLRLTGGLREESAEWTSTANTAVVEASEPPSAVAAPVGAGC